MRLTKRAIKALAKLPTKDRLAIRTKLAMLAEDSASPTLDIVPLQDVENGYRLRVGRYRVLFSIHQQIIQVDAIAHRKEVYR